MPHMCRNGKDGTQSQIHAEMPVIKLQGLIKGEVLAAESGLQEAEAGNKRKQPDLYNTALPIFARSSRYKRHFSFIEEKTPNANTPRPDISAQP